MLHDNDDDYIPLDYYRSSSTSNNKSKYEKKNKNDTLPIWESRDYPLHL